MKKNKHSKKSKGLSYEEKTFFVKRDKPVSEISKEIPKEQEPEPKKPNYQSRELYSHTKTGDKFTIFYAGFFALIFLLPGISIALTEEDGTASFISILIGTVPLRYVFKEFYSIKITVTKTYVEYVHTAVFKKTIAWQEPLKHYSHFTKFLSEEESTSMLWHSSDDSKNVILHTTFYRNENEALKKFEEINVFLKHSSFGKQMKSLYLERAENYSEKNFFDVYNRSKIDSLNLKRFLLPDKHIKLLNDESNLFFASVNEGSGLFIAGLCLLLLSFLMLVITYKIGGVAFWCFVFHLFGILLLNFGTTEQTLKLEKRTLSIGKRYFKRRVSEKERIPFANITAVEVMEHVSAIEKENPVFSLKIKTENSFYEYGRSSNKEELEWLADTIVDRIIKINDTFFIKEEYTGY